MLSSHPNCVCLQSSPQSVLFANHFSSLNYLIYYKKEFHGDINALSDDYKDVIPDADVIFLCMPVHQYRNALKKLAPFINRSKKEVFVGTIYGQAGFNWMVSAGNSTIDVRFIDDACRLTM